jgi:hypothetical protein
MNRLSQFKRNSKRCRLQFERHRHRRMHRSSWRRSIPLRTKHSAPATKKPQLSLVIGLTLAVCLLPLAVSCRSSPPLPQSKPVKDVPPTSRRTMTFRGLDNDYRGSSLVSPDEPIQHRKERRE